MVRSTALRRLAPLAGLALLAGTGLASSFAAGEGGAAATGPAPAYTGFTNGGPTDHVRWLDTSGNLINAHDGGILYADGRYHWYGMALRPLSVKQGGQKTTTGVVMYASADLYNWTYEGVILACATDPADPLCGPMRFERPKIVYNDRTKQYVLWCHYVARPGDHGTKPGSGEAGVATCGTVNGRYAFRGTTRPVDGRGMVRDSTLFKDDDGSAYFIYDRDVRTKGPDFGRVLHVVKLSDDYLAATSTAYTITTAVRREAPVVVKRGRYYFLITSAETGWAFNRANYYRATAIGGPYVEVGDPCAGQPLADTTYNSQGTYAFPVEGRPDRWLLLAERHDTACMTDSSFLVLPVEFPTPATLRVPYVTAWSLKTD